MRFRPPHSVVAELRAIRERRNLTQADIAAAMRTSAPAVSQMETGSKPPLLSTVVRYADALGYDLTLTPKETRSQ